MRTTMAVVMVLWVVALFDAASADAGIGHLTNSQVSSTKYHKRERCRKSRDVINRAGLFCGSLALAAMGHINDHFVAAPSHDQGEIRTKMSNTFSLEKRKKQRGCRFHSNSVKAQCSFLSRMLYQQGVGTKNVLMTAYFAPLQLPKLKFLVSWRS